MKGYPFETPEIEIARDGVYGCSSEHTPKIHWLHLILRNADGTQMGFCGIDQVLVHAIWSIYSAGHCVVAIPILSVLALYVTGTWTNRSLLPFRVEQHQTREFLRSALRHRLFNLILNICGISRY